MKKIINLSSLNQSLFFVSQKMLLLLFSQKNNNNFFSPLIQRKKIFMLSEKHRIFPTGISNRIHLRVCYGKYIIEFFCSFKGESKYSTYSSHC